MIYRGRLNRTPSGPRVIKRYTKNIQEAIDLLKVFLKQKNGDWIGQLQNIGECTNSVKCIILSSEGAYSPEDCFFGISNTEALAISIAIYRAKKGGCHA